MPQLPASALMWQEASPRGQAPTPSPCHGSLAAQGDFQPGGKFREVGSALWILG